MKRSILFLTLIFVAESIHFGTICFCMQNREDICSFGYSFDALGEAIYRNDKNALIKEINKGTNLRIPFDVAFTHKKGCTKTTPLQYAIEWEHFECAHIILEHLGINEKDYKGRTALILSCHYAPQEISIFEIAGDNREIIDGIVETDESFAFFKYLLAQKADVNVAGGHKKRMPLHYAVLNHHHERVDELIKAGADIYATDGEGISVFGMALDTFSSKFDPHLYDVSNVCAQSIAQVLVLQHHQRLEKNKKSNAY